MLRTLYFRLSLALVGLFLVIGIALVVLTRYSSDRYYQEVTQRLNAPIAMYVAGEAPLIRDGVANTQALQTLAHQAMVINPTVEVYLLDTEGRVLGHDLGEDALVRANVDLEPLRQFVRGAPNLPLRGDDPRSNRSRKVFSAAEVRNAGVLEGFVYVVLGGEKYEQFAASAELQQALRLGTLAVIGCLLFGLGSALLIFARTSRRLRGLTSKVNAFCAERIGQEPRPRDGAPDEIVQLADAFGAMQTRIDEQLNEILRTDRMRRELVAHVSHDLRTPLAAIQGYIETLTLKQGSLTSGQQRRYLDVVHNHAVRLGRLIDDLFELARLDAGIVEAQADRFCVAELVADVAQEFQLAAERKGLRLTVERHVDDSFVRADIRLIERVITNLLDNALRHTPGGGCIVVRLDGQADGIQIAVADSGGGILPQHIPRLFERGFTVAAPGNESAESTGLGLAIVKRILELHHAPVAVVSDPGKGSRFSFLLPRNGPANHHTSLTKAAPAS